jgi:hypothetical protein
VPAGLNAYVVCIAVCKGICLSDQKREREREQTVLAGLSHEERERETADSASGTERVQ